ncbi:unnamed protein product [Vicia faba]|uniref:WRC domain-containing protein n=1 Tax=Vicia faba TaxID=3906 RepID=A0AAV1AW54_VICFA|nr:unnamed protein product [Vicia faba]
MRIRKRQAILSSSLHLSDPNQFNPSPLMVQLSDGAHAHTQPKPCSSSASLLVSAGSTLDLYQPSDQTLPLIGKLNNGYDYPSTIQLSGVHKHHTKQHPLEEKVRVEGKEGGDFGENKSNHISKGNILVDSQLLPSSTTFVQDGRWCEGEKAIPLKKRKGRLENVGMDSDDSKKTKMKTKLNKRCSMRKDEDGDEQSETKVNDMKKRATKRGSALMEGSRCSRVNGRGWRCCQQTLVGYSLCEHHLGKGRLRSMTSVRNRSIGFSTTATTTTTVAPSNVVDRDTSASSSNSDLVKKMTSGNDIVDKLENDDDEKKPVIMVKKRMKLGMVKARSMSSLLGQTDNKVVVVDENNK